MQCINCHVVYILIQTVMSSLTRLPHKWILTNRHFTALLLSIWNKHNKPPLVWLCSEMLLQCIYADKISSKIQVTNRKNIKHKKYIQLFIY